MRASTTSKDPIRLLLTDFTKTFGGAPEHAVSLTKYLSLSGRARVAFLSPQLQLKERIESSGGEFVMLDLPDDRMRKIPSNNPLTKAGYLLKEWIGEEIPTARQIWRVAKDTSSDLIQLNNLPTFQRSGVLASRFLKTPCIATHQGFEQPSRSLQYILPLIDMHVAISRAVEQHILDLGVPRERVCLIHDAIDASRFHPAVEPVNFSELFQIPPGAPTFGIVGRIVGWKGHRMFMDVASLVLKEMPDARAIIVGDVSDGEAAYEKELREKAQQLGIAEKVIFAGRRNNVPEFVKALDVALHLSREPEPLGLVVAEALAVGTPVVGMNEGGVPDMLSDGESGFLCSPDAASPIADAVLRLLRDPELRKRFGTYGSKTAREGFGGELCAEKYSALYEQMLSSRATKH